MAVALDNVVREMVEGKDVAVAFSGGLDCSIIASLTRRYARSVHLYTAGMEGAYDIQEGEEMSKILDIPWTPIIITQDEILDSVREMMSVTRTYNPVTLSFEIPLFYVSRVCTESLVIGGQGADELFAGYSKYIDISASELKDRMRSDLERLLNDTLGHEKCVAQHFGKTILYPYLDKSVIEIAQAADLGELSPSALRKRALREVACCIGEEEAAAKKKKAAQYGSGSVCLLRKVAKQRGTTVNGLISQLRDSIDSDNRSCRTDRMAVRPQCARHQAGSWQHPRTPAPSRRSAGFILQPACGRHGRERVRVRHAVLGLVRGRIPYGPVHVATPDILQ